MSFDLPGLKKEDIQIEFANGQLRIFGERKDEREQGKGTRYQSEKYYGYFERAIALPESVKGDQIEAHFENGVLHVAVPKAAAIQPKQIKIGEGKTGIFSKLLGRKEEKPSKTNAA
jgi:HSP20 family protein